MVCLTLGVVLNAFELKRFESLPAAKSFTKTSTSLVLPLQSLRQSWRFSSFSMLVVVMVLDPSDNIPTPSLNKKRGPESRVYSGQQNSCCFFKAYEREHFKYCGKPSSCIVVPRAASHLTGTSRRLVFSFVRPKNAKKLCLVCRHILY